MRIARNGWNHGAEFVRDDQKPDGRLRPRPDRHHRVRKMTRRWLILADDLTGAADSAIPFARRGLESVVGWGDPPGLRPDTPVFAHNTDSRGLGARAAAEKHGRALEALFEPGLALFKKIDSTLRGQPAAEIAATMAHVKGAGPAFGILAPAFPATGRTTQDGRVRVHGRPLEEEEVWRRDHSYGSASLPEILATAGVAAHVVPLATVRAGRDELAAAFARIAGLGDIVAICDAETDDDLHRIAEASLPLAHRAISSEIDSGSREDNATKPLVGAFLAGSAGLAAALAALAPRAPVSEPAFETGRAGFLMVVGSLATASRKGARKLVAGGRVAHVPVSPETLLHDASERAAIGSAVAALLGNGEDVLVEIRVDGAPDMALGPGLAEGLAGALAPAASRMSAFAATGGETAAALLSRFGVDGIRLLDEIEPGVALGRALGARSCPVVTKAGAFGDEDSLGRIAERLRALRMKGHPA
jgi:uncharacterized protein YgbK (DUF1537 family)